MDDIKRFCPKLKYLKNEWQIKEVNNQSEVSFTIDFEIKNV